MASKFLTGIDLQSQRATNAADPQAATDLVTKQYADNLLAGLAWKAAVRVATTANIASIAGGAPNTLDGVTLALNDRVLVKDQTTASGNGIYTVTTLGTGANGTWSRTTDADTGAEMVNATVYVSEGTVNADKAFTQTANAPITLGTTSLVWSQVGGGTSYTAGNGMQLASTTFSVLPDPVSGGGVAVTAAGVKVDATVVARKYSVAVGNGSLTSITVTHGLGSLLVSVDVYNTSTGELVSCDVTRVDANTVTLVFATAPTTGQYTCVVIG